MEEITTHSADQTRRLGHCLGRIMKRGVALRLCGDLGSGKTCFVQGLARGLDVPEAYDITSPTYTLINAYPGRLPFYHVDLYRLSGQMDIETLGLEEILGYEAVVAVEWAERLPDEEWPEHHLQIEFSIAEGDAHRIRLNGYGLEMDDLIREAVELYRS